MPKRKKPRAERGLPAISPAVLVGEERKIYQEIRELLIEIGHDNKAGVMVVIVCCRQIARMHNLAEQVRKLESFSIPSATTMNLDPLVKELRSVESAVNMSLTKLLLTPRSKQGARLQPEPQEADPIDDNILKLLGS